MAHWLTLRAGRTAKRVLREKGFSSDLFSLLLGASGGPKWLVLSQMDRVLCRRFLQERKTPLDLLGSSIGSLRHACFAQSAPAQAIARLEDAYVGQAYEGEVSPDDVSQVSRGIVRELLGPKGAAEIAQSQQRRCHIVTARCMPATSAPTGLKLKAGLGGAAFANLFSRGWLKRFFERVVFSAGSRRFGFEDLPTHVAPLTEGNTEDAILASGSIPLVMSPVEDIAEGPKGRYLDGGIIDYHFDPRATHGDGLVLYPHFFDRITPGWFDKGLTWRRPTAEALDNVLLISPSPKMVARLPNQKIPDRKDFYRFDTKTRQDIWRRTISECTRMAEELEELIAQGTLPDHL